MVEKIREEGEKWVIKQGEGIFIYLFLSPLYNQLIKHRLDMYKEQFRIPLANA